MGRIVLLFISLFFCSAPMQAQVTIKGKLVNDKNKPGIGFITVGFLTQKDSSIIKELSTDSSGTFTFTYHLPGKYILRFSSVGYQPLYQQIVLKNEQPVLNLGDIVMITAQNLLNEVVVNGNQPAWQRQAGKLVVTVAGNKFFKTAANAIDIFKKIPGLEVAGDGSLLLSGRISPAVFIDGKPVPMSAEELQNYLATLSPETISAIEVIDNPSSQYDGEHKGIINIKLKPDLTLGWKGSVSTTIQRNDYTMAENNFQLTYKSPKLVHTARLGYTGGSTIRTYQALQHQANTNIMATNTKIITRNNNFHFQYGVDYTINKQQRIDLSLRASKLNRPVDTYNTLYTTDSSAKQIVFNTNSNNLAEAVQRNFGVNVNYTARLGKQQLQVLTSLLKISNRQREDIQNKNAITTRLIDHWKTALKNDIFIRTAQADLSRELTNSKWSAGAKFSFITTNNDLHYDTLNTSLAFETDSNRTNAFQYDEYITAGYISYEQKLNKFNFIAGLRAEHTHSIANAVTTNEVIRRNYVTWLPSLNVSYALLENQQLNMAVTRRITRPPFPHLNPFRFYFSPLNYWVGNPYLLPAVTSVVTVSYSQKAFTASINLGREKDPISRYPEYNRVTNILEYLGRNLPYNDFAGATISVPVSLTKWWRTTHTINGLYKKEQTPYHGVTYAIPITWITVTGNQVFTLPKGFTFDVYYYYRSRNGDGLYVQRHWGFIDLGLQKAWLKGKINSKINYYDILNTYKIRQQFREKDIIDNRFTHWFGMNRMAVTVSYSFGKSTYKTKQQNRNEEETRVGL